MVFGPWDAFGVVGLVLLLGAFAANALGRLAQGSRLYSGLNAVGAGILAVYAYVTAAWVFLPLEFVWCLVAVWALVRPAAPSTA